MTEGTKQCPFCAETIKSEAVVCRYCGRNVEGSAGNAQDKNPALGFLGLAVLIIGAGICAFSGGGTFGIVITIIGAGILGYALISGNIKLFG
ncbi:MAG: hypothetical protein IAE79_02585 [Anaerolinea sp.]|nr:hypothetical protein [Anaerolinea sp.]